MRIGYLGVKCYHHLYSHRHVGRHLLGINVLFYLWPCKLRRTRYFVPDCRQMYVCTGRYVAGKVRFIADRPLLIIPPKACRRCRRGHRVYDTVQRKTVTSAAGTVAVAQGQVVISLMLFSHHTFHPGDDPC